MNLSQKRHKPDVSRIVAVVLCGASVVACLAYDHARNTLPDWWRGHGGGIPYVCFWIAFWFAILPYRRCILPICVVVTASTCLLEFMQLWKPAWLMQVRATRFGAALLGSGFTWSDLPPYFIGGVVGGLILVLISRGSRKAS
jgi:uncharacterized protein DUF2809